MQRYLDQVDEQANAEIARHTAPGRAGVYEAKYQEAVRYPEGRHPYITAEARRLGLSEVEVATRILDARECCEAACAEIEAARVAAKASIRAAGTPADMHRIADTWR